MISNKLLKLARLIKCISEISTDNGLLITDVEFEVGVEVFVTDPETGDLTPAPAGTYTSDDLVIVVNEQGIIESISDKTNDAENIENPAETPETLEDNKEDEEEKKDEEEEKTDEEEKSDEEEEKKEEEEKLDEEETPDEKDAKIAELQGLLDAANAKIAELEALIAEYKAKEEETPESIEEENRKHVMQHTEKEETANRTERILNALKNKK